MKFKTPIRLSRRTFSNLLTMSAITQTLPCHGSDNTNQSSNWIDAHVHVWHPDTKRYPLAVNYHPKDMQPPSFTEDQLWSLCEPHGVKRIVLIQMSFYEHDHRYMSEVMQRYPDRFAGVSLIKWDQPRLKTEVKRHRKIGMRGFRMHSKGDANRWPSDTNVKKLWKLAAEYDLAICPLINPDDIQSINLLCRQFPSTKVIIDHFARIGVDGNIREKQLDGLCELANYPNTHVKASAFYALGEKRAPYLDLLPMIKRVIDAFGSERVMWASDCPFQVQSPHTYQASIDLIQKHATFLSQHDKIEILRGTAERLFFG